MQVNVCKFGESESLTLEVEPTSIVSELIELVKLMFTIEEDFVLICNDKVLPIDSTIESLKLSENDMIYAKARPAGPQRSCSQPVRPGFIPPVRTDVYLTPAEPADLEDRIRNLMEIGYPRDKVVEALKKAKYNPDQAYEILSATPLLTNDQKHRILDIQKQLAAKGHSVGREAIIKVCQEVDFDEDKAIAKLVPNPE